MEVWFQEDYTNNDYNNEDYDNEYYDNEDYDNNNEESSVPLGATASKRGKPRPQHHRLILSHAFSTTIILSSSTIILAH